MGVVTRICAQDVDDFGSGFHARVHDRFHGAEWDRVEGELEGFESDGKEFEQQAFGPKAGLGLMRDD